MLGLRKRTLPSARATFMPWEWPETARNWQMLLRVPPRSWTGTFCCASQNATLGWTRNLDPGPWMSAANFGAHSHQVLPPHSCDQGSFDACWYFSANRIVLDVPSGKPRGEPAVDLLVQSPDLQSYSPTSKTRWL